jgi:LPS-assembly protein
VDSGLIFNRDFNFLHNAYTQTLEPRVFYLFVPNVKQDNIQIFDTTLPALDFNQLFRTNRFSGYDRIGDANQVTLALTSRLLDDFGQEKLNLGLGQILLLQKHRVSIANEVDPLMSEQVSPLVGQIQYFMNAQWSSGANIAWDPNYHQFETANMNLQYNYDAKSIASLWYNFTRDGDAALKPASSSVPVGSSNLNRFGVALSWPLFENWHILGSLDYNISHTHAQNYFYGIEYDNCCWAIRVVQSKVFASVNPSGNNTYNSTFYLQILLKGLGNLGTSNAGGLLARQIPGYQDKFAAGYKI